MTLGVCSREKEVLELLKKGQWAQACPDDLHVHVAGCRACGDLVLVTEVFQNDRAKMASLAPIPSSGPLWWRAQLRRRNSAFARRPDLCPGRDPAGWCGLPHFAGSKRHRLAIVASRASPRFSL